MQTNKIYDAEELTTEECIEMCMKYLEIFIQEKRALETITEPKPLLTRELGWGGFEPNRLLLEKQRAKKQKEKNDEYLPQITVILHTLKVIHSKIPTHDHHHHQETEEDPNL
jgi:hypothetical protein